MAVTLVYTDATLADWLMDRLRGRLSEYLGWSVAAGSFDDVIEATLIAYGVAEITEIPATVDGIRKLRAIALAELWTAVLEALTVEIDHSADGASFSRSQLYSQAQGQLDRAWFLAAAYGWSSGSSAVIDRVTDAQDPYTWNNTQEWS